MSRMKLSQINATKIPTWEGFKPRATEDPLPMDLPLPTIVGALGRRIILADPLCLTPGTVPPETVVTVVETEVAVEEEEEEEEEGEVAAVMETMATQTRRIPTSFRGGELRKSGS